MKKPLFFLLASISLSFGVVSPHVGQVGSQPVFAQTQQQQALNLELIGHLRTTERNWRGEERVAWRSLEGGFMRPAPRVRPGDIVRYTVNGNNRTDQPLSGLVLTDDLPENTVYVMGSAAAVGGATVTFSIDGGQTYSANPTIQVTLPNGRVETRPAPAERYTHVRWTFRNAVPARAAVSGQYQVRVR
ncbi:hypothetical protein NIES970_28260 (plasmid) [[Synechococcus] sp. NIES-970]|uniref:DUF11 domain-containing protein n=1 Tax=Picosynechococcus sp. NKBG15041c TaxID=1407650 RepID=UPI00040CD2AD|nr:DUF11 domain-containing protein [Picosynechococcus sp. NKBG15041c]BAW97863.1 hypothetical protein NIES970_28260 [[Synechococcus] sp. NIES-970]